MAFQIGTPRTDRKVSLRDDDWDRRFADVGRHSDDPTFMAQPEALALSSLPSALATLFPLRFAGRAGEGPN